jgi:uncharacterized membrane protein
MARGLEAYGSTGAEIMKHPWYWAWGLCGLVVVMTGALYPWLPERMPTHWNLQGEVDGWSSPLWGAWLTPAIMVGTLVLLQAVPWLSPQPFTIEPFRPTYHRVVLLMLLLFVAFQALLLAAAFTERIAMDRAIVGTVCVFLALLGNRLGQVQRNFYVGVRTPWTLASERVWNETHRLAAWVFTGCGAVGALLAAMGVVPWLGLVLLGVGALAVVVFSLVRYKQLEQQNAL